MSRRPTQLQEIIAEYEGQVPARTDQTTRVVKYAKDGRTPLVIEQVYVDDEGTVWTRQTNLETGEVHLHHTPGERGLPGISTSGREQGLTVPRRLRRAFGVEAAMGTPEKPHVSETVGHYLARQGMYRNGMEWDAKLGGFRYDIHTVYNEKPTTQKDVDRTAKRLPLVVPGLKVVKSEFRKRRSWGDHGIVWFTWDRQDMEARYRELFKKYGAADERLAYQECSGTVHSPDGQQRLPGVVEVEPRVTAGFEVGMGAAWTVSGLMQMDGGFCHRIREPNKGGPEAIPFNQQITVGNEWWFVGSRGDSVEILTLEIEGSPLDERTKKNLIENLADCYGDLLSE